MTLFFNKKIAREKSIIPIRIDATASGIYANCAGINFANVIEPKATKTPKRADVSSHQTNFVVGDWILLMF